MRSGLPRAGPLAPPVCSDRRVSLTDRPPCRAVQEGCPVRVLACPAPQAQFAKALAARESSLSPGRAVGTPLYTPPARSRADAARPPVLAASSTTPACRPPQQKPGPATTQMPRTTRTGSGARLHVWWATEARGCGGLQCVARPPLPPNQALAALAHQQQASTPPRAPHRTRTSVTLPLSTRSLAVRSCGVMASRTACSSPARRRIWVKQWMHVGAGWLAQPALSSWQATRRQGMHTKAAQASAPRLQSPRCCRQPRRSLPRAAAGGERV